MALPNPLPDNPLKWDGWKNYNSSNYYARLCIDFGANSGDQAIEENCRQLLVWWQKKLPLKNQPSNPIAQILRQGLDEAPHFLAEARTKLLNPEERRKIDAELHRQLIAEALGEFRKLLSFTIADKKLTPDGEARLQNAGRRLGLSDEDMQPVIEEELERTGSIRVTVELDLPSPSAGLVPTSAPTAPVVSPPGAWSGPAAAAAGSGDPSSEFRRILKMSRLCLDGEEMTDDQRDAMCNLGESLGLTGGQAEDLIDEYLEETAAMPVAPSPPASAAPAAPTRGGAVAAPRQPAPLPQPAAGRPAIGKTAPVPETKPVQEINTSPAGRASERNNFPNFVNSAGLEMYLIPSGKVEIGCSSPGAQDNERPVTPVTIGCFMISRFPVTNGQFEQFDPAHKNKRSPWADDSHPVTYVTWNDAVEFCRWLSRREGKRYRLPTEAEWEYAARGDDKRIFPWGNDFSSGELANFADARTRFTWREPGIDDGFSETAPVGSFPKGISPFGIEDLAGNVFEWCQDWFDAYRGKPAVNPTGPGGGRNRVYRGGSWRSRISSLRATARNSNIPDYMGNDVGFRVVCECE